ncbi:MAG: ABC transporter ATP-binding protein [Myxococcales bacterium FL481]|nr:MAG: ABC transporter ATP-binding protein [Myxococcales bacterium FL481]
MNAWRAELSLRRGPFHLDVNLCGPSGTVALVGPNGSGKTTLLRALAGAVVPDQAEIVIGGRVVASTRERIWVPAEARRVGYVPQGYALFPHLSVLDNVAFGLSTGSNALPRDERYARARAILRRLDCARLEDEPPAQLSGGEQQRVALARALVLEPDLLLLDEPLAALDAAARRQVRRFLAEHLATFARPAIVVTHDVRDVSALSATVWILDHGRMVQSGTREQLIDAPANAFVSEFVGGNDSS